MGISLKETISLHKELFAASNKLQRKLWAFGVSLSVAISGVAFLGPLLNAVYLGLCVEIELDLRGAKNYERVKILQNYGFQVSISTFFVHLSAFCFATLTTVILQLAGLQYYLKLRESYFLSFLHHDHLFWDSVSKNEVTSRLIMDLNTIRDYVAGVLAESVEAFFKLLVGITLMISLSPMLSGIQAVMVFRVYLKIHVGKMIRVFAGEVQDVKATITSWFIESFTNVDVLKSSNRESFCCEILTQRQVKLFMIEMRLLLVMAFLNMLDPAMLALQFLYLECATLFAFQQQGFGLEQFYFFRNSFLEVEFTALKLLNIVITWSTLIGAVKRIWEYKEYENIVKSGVGLIFSKNTPYCNFHIKDVYVTLNGVKILKGMSGIFRRTEVSAICGPSGGGKSTTIRSILRFVEPDNGAVTYGSVNIRQYEITSFRLTTSFCTQEPTLFTAPVADNITILSPVDLTKVYFYCKLSLAHQFVLNLPADYDTVVGTTENSVQVSGGQMRRLCLARGLYLRTPFLLMDESTTGLEKPVEIGIIENVKTYFKIHDRGVVLISHSPYPFPLCQSIILVCDGINACSGLHENLLKDERMYREFYSGVLQENEVKDDENDDDKVSLPVEPVLSMEKLSGDSFQNFESVITPTDEVADVKEKMKKKRKQSSAT